MILAGCRWLFCCGGSFATPAGRIAAETLRCAAWRPRCASLRGPPYYPKRGARSSVTPSLRGGIEILNSKFWPSPKTINCKRSQIRRHTRELIKQKTFQKRIETKEIDENTKMTEERVLNDIFTSVRHEMKVSKE